MAPIRVEPTQGQVLGELDSESAHVQSTTLSSECCSDHVSYLNQATKLIMGNCSPKDNQLSDGQLGLCLTLRKPISCKCLVGNGGEKSHPENGQDGTHLTFQNWLWQTEKAGLMKQLFRILTLSEQNLFLSPCTLRCKYSVWAPRNFYLTFIQSISNC